MLESAGDDDDDDDDDDDTRRRAYVHVRLYARGHIHDARRTTTTTTTTTHDARRGDSRAGGLKFKRRE